jgi:hypothetical protein
VFQVKMLRAGTLFMKDGNQTPIKPNTALEMIIENENGKSTKRGAGRLILHEPLDVQGIELTLQNWQEVSILSYRYNPGRPILWVSALALLAAMTFRIWAYWYRIEYLAAGPGDNRKLYLRVMHNGLLADSERIIDKIRSSLQKVIS